MFMALVLLVFGVLLFDMRGRLKAAEQRLAVLEGGAALARAALAPQPFDGEVRPSRPTPWDEGRKDDGSDAAEARALRSAAIVERRAVGLEPPPPAAPIDEPMAEPAERIEAPRHPSFSFEDLFGRRLPIWAGGATLAVAGVLLVKYSIDAGLLSPLVRIVMGLLFGGALIGGAELALRQEERVRDPRVRQALSGAGLATLYVSILAAHTLYGLIGPGIAFVGLAGVTGLAMALSLRFGAPSALLGLVGGLAAPALVEAGQPNVPLLSCYLALAVGGLTVLSRTQRWMWLGVSALIGGAGWGAIMLAMGALDWASSLSVGLLVLMLGVGLPLFAFSETRGTLLRVGAAIVAAAQMAALVATGGFGLLQWGLFGLLSVALVWLGREAALRPLAAVGAGVALLLAAVWPDPEMGRFTLVLLGMVAIYGGAAIWRVWRVGGLVEAGQIAGLALGGFFLGLGHFWRAGLDGEFALLALAAAALPGVAMALGWRCEGRRNNARFVTLASAGALLLVIAGGLGLADWMLPVVVAAVTAGLLVLAERAQDPRVEWSGWAFAFAAVVLLAGSVEMARLWGQTSTNLPAQGVLRWGAVAAMAALFAWRAKFAEGRMVAQGVAVLLAYGAAAQVVPGLWLAVAAALGLAALAEGARRLAVGRMLPGLAVAALLVLLWACWPLGMWLGRALLSLTAEPMLVRDLPAPGAVLQRLALPALLLGLALWRAGETVGPWARRGGWIMAGVMAGVAVHIGYKQLFGLTGPADVTRLALAERTVWEALLIGAGLAFQRWDQQGLRLPFPLATWQPQGLAAVTTGLAHMLVYTVVLHDPLWFPQQVGSLPLANLLPPAFGLAFVALLVMEQSWQWAKRPADMLRMGLIAWFGLAMLRQIFVGSLLTVPGLGQAEDILRSVLALGLAIGFLLWGIRKRARDWRIASLLLMLAAVAKVFLFDASGLTGLLRIASFLALGFSLIGIGWLYNRVLREPVNNSATIAA